MPLQITNIWINMEFFCAFLFSGCWSSSLSSVKFYVDLFHRQCQFTDSGKRFGNQSRRSLQGPEHDGLLGSGSFPRPTGYAPGSSAPKFRANVNYQPNRSNEPYHPPRPYKVNSLICSNLLVRLIYVWQSVVLIYKLLYDFHLML
jgi:hypothetical protein